MKGLNGHKTFRADYCELAMCGCGCGCVALVLCDAGGKAHATAAFTTEGWATVLGQIADVAEAAAADAHPRH